MKNPSGVGAFCWYEVAVRDKSAAKSFYGELFVADIEETAGKVKRACGAALTPVMNVGDMGRSVMLKDPTGSYTIFARGEEQIGGMMKTPQKGMPSHWVPYFQVDSCDRAVEIVKRRKGQVPMGPMDVPEVGRIAMVADPQGAFLGFVQPPKK
ncbi:MAG: VOC family protein [Deltaproteobacteria bacterium]|nr:VOC family protein [Deltaproteobacteria bacterium]